MATRTGTGYIYDLLERWAERPANIPKMNEWQRNMLMQYFTNLPYLQQGREGTSDKVALQNLFERPLEGENLEGEREDVNPRFSQTGYPSGPPDWLRQLAPRMTGKVSRGPRGKMRSFNVPDPKMMIDAILGTELRDPAGVKGGPTRKGWEEGWSGREEREKWLEEDLFGELIGEDLIHHLYSRGDYGGKGIAEARFGKEPWKKWTESQKRMAPPLYDYLWSKEDMAAQGRLQRSRADRANEGMGFLGELFKPMVKGAVSGGLSGLGGLGGMMGIMGGGMQDHGMPEWEEWLKQMYDRGGGMQYSPNQDWGSYDWGGY